LKAGATAISSMVSADIWWLYVPCANIDSPRGRDGAAGTLGTFAGDDHCFGGASIRQSIQTEVEDGGDLRV
jgi:hypothetical protein